MSTVSRQTFDEVMVPNYQPSAIIPVRGAGSRVWDQEGREYVDFACGIAVTVLGHCHPKVVAALTEQANKLWHVSNVMTNEPALRLAQKLTSLTFADKAFFCNSGAEANEAAFKLARRYGTATHGEHKHQIIAFNNAFHGRTMFTVTVGGTPKYSQGFGPAIPGVTHLPYNDVAALEAAVGAQTCAVVMEPVQGEGGVTPATAEFVKKARELCSKHDALLVFDEVQSGNARSGTLFAYQQLGVTPDILTTAKGLGGGFPIGAMLTTDKYAQVLSFGTHGSTYGGNALACATALAVIDELLSPAIAANVTARAAQLRAGLEAIGKRYGVFSQVRGMGMLIGAALNEPWKGKAKDVVAAGLRHGVWFLVAGGDVLRFAPALNISEADMAEGLKRMDAAVAELTAPAKVANA